MLSEKVKEMVTILYWKKENWSFRQKTKLLKQQVEDMKSENMHLLNRKSF